jgi:hypothetical protein
MNKGHNLSEPSEKIGLSAEKQGFYDPNSPQNQDYATVEVNGKTVAKIANNGYVTTSGAMAASLHELFAAENKTLSGPALWQERGEKIAQLLGGSMVKSASAMDQAAYLTTAKKVETTSSSATLSNATTPKVSVENLEKSQEAQTLFMA